MEFKDFFNLLKPLLGNYKSNADLVRVFFEMVTKTDTSPEELDLKSRETLKAYANGKRKFQPSLARVLIDKLDLKNFVESINSNSIEVLQKLSQDYNLLSPNNKSTPETISIEISKDFFNYVYNLAGEKQNSESKVSTNPIYLKHRFGDELLIENKGYCSFKNCNKILTTEIDGEMRRYYEVVVIDKNEEENADNLIALCPECANKYNSSRNQEDEDFLSNVKMSQRDSLLSMKNLSNVYIEKTISELLDSLLDDDYEVDTTLNYNPTTVKNKLKGSSSIFINKNIMNVTQYYPFIDEQLKSLSREKRMNSDLLANQIRNAYLTALSGTKIKEEIFEALVNNLNTTFNKERAACEIVISYYIKNCEVFDDTTK